MAVWKPEWGVCEGDKRYDNGVQLCDEIHAWGTWWGAPWRQHHLLWCVWRFNGYTKELQALWWDHLSFYLHFLGRILVSCHEFWSPPPGFNFTADACCGLGRYRGWIMCLSPEMACSNASNHIWWDQFHPTDVVNAILADNVWSSLHTGMCYPSNLQDMLVAKARWIDGEASQQGPNAYCPIKYLIFRFSYLITWTSAIFISKSRMYNTHG